MATKKNAQETSTTPNKDEVSETKTFPDFVHNGVKIRTSTDGETFTAEVVRARGVTRYTRSTREAAETAAREAIDHGAA